MLETKLERLDDGQLRLTLLGSLDEDGDIDAVFAQIDGPVTI